MHEIGCYPSKTGKMCDIASANIDTLFQKTQLGFITCIITNFLIFYHDAKFSFLGNLSHCCQSFLKEKTHPMMKAGANQCHRQRGLGTRRREDLC